jgi:hypothetical protein
MLIAAFKEIPLVLKERQALVESNRRRRPAGIPDLLH